MKKIHYYKTYYYFVTYFADGKWGNMDVSTDLKLNSVAAMYELKNLIAKKINCSTVVITNLIELKTK